MIYVVKDGALVTLFFNLFAIALCDRRAIAISSRDKQYVFLANTIS
jgi:hypothetical protein